MQNLINKNILILYINNQSINAHIWIVDHYEPCDKRIQRQKREQDNSTKITRFFKPKAHNTSSTSACTDEKNAQPDEYEPNIDSDENYDANVYVCSK